ncbi:odorant receptor 131-2-like [Corythoichthys intestinalis]|uniref:odorant receptor 131-2-like n=1 Tax=Corythoichthys intestinalis TaxID=161448 RepID=UPI0025A5A495|nr:odorant receptor 131-2-like [Corythoichthys intestinalis]XP_061801263.1 odorant receptor 131-2-like [Nerophis lumbriciformis]
MLQANVTSSERDKVSLMERVAAGTFIASFCLVFLIVNGVMLFTLRSKCVFRETSRYILLFHLLLGDTLQMVVSQLIYFLSTLRVTLTYPVCGVLIMLNYLFSRISPLVLVAMSLERYVAVCHPLRHASITTARNTVAAALALWSFCFLNILIQGFLLMMFPFHQLESLQMSQLCNFISLAIEPVSLFYNKFYMYFMFASASLCVLFSYVGVVVSARSANTGKHLARKAQNTLLLHLVQLGLTLISLLYATIMTNIAVWFTSWLAFVRFHTFIFVLFFQLPRCLSSLVYGLKDRDIRVVLVYNLCCHLHLPVAPAKAANVF